MAAGLSDILAPGLSVVFCGLNPGAEDVAAGHHFVGKAERFWRVIHLAGFTPMQIDPLHDTSLLSFGCGLTALVERPTAGAEEVTYDEFMAGSHALRRKIERYAPRKVAFLGRAAFAPLGTRREISWGRQPITLGSTELWVLPSPGGRNGGFSLAALVEAYGQLRRGPDGAATIAR